MKSLLQKADKTWPSKQLGINMFLGNKLFLELHILDDGKDTCNSLSNSLE
jgi:hypothetical protein